MEGSYLFFSLIEYFRFIMNLDYIIYKSYMKLFYHVCYRTIKIFKLAYGDYVAHVTSVSVKVVINLVACLFQYL